MMLEVLIEADEEWDSSGDLEALIRRAAEAAVAESDCPEITSSPRPIELSVRLTGNEQVRALNAQWRDKDKPTNVLSFPLASETDLQSASVDGPQLLLGDIVLAYGVCSTEAADQDIPLAHHAAHLAAHGTLHLLGFDHGDEPSAEDMESRESRALARLGIADPYGERC